jgi:predicted phage terminase large subunit-like protein
MKYDQFSNDEIKKIINNKDQRISISKDSHYWFFIIYLSHYIKYEFAPFHHEMFKLTEDESINPLCITAFRSSAKTTICTLSYVLWSILGKPKKKYIVLLGQTQRQARQLLANIRDELENNELLKNDLGPFKEHVDEWGSYSIVLPWYDARITAVSMEQTIRGMRHKQYRPDLIIADDVEDIRNVKSKESRDNVEEWIYSEIIPAGELDTRILFIGNLLHEDSLMMRTKKKINGGQMDGKYVEMPLIDEEGNIAWPGKYKNMDDIEKLKRKVSDFIFWSREYLLKIISSFEKVIHSEWIQYYDEFPSPKKLRHTYTGIDLAISQKETANYTAMVSANVYGYEDELEIYIMPNPINKRMTHNETLETAKSLSTTLGNGQKTELFVEDVGYQKSMVQELERFHYPVKGIKVHGADKKARLKLISHLVQNGAVKFPRKGCELLISQLTGFGKEKYDDLADAFSLLINQIVNGDNKYKEAGVMGFSNGKLTTECFIKYGH